MAQAPLFAEMFWAKVNDPATSGKLALTAQARSVTYRELGDLVAARAQALLANGSASGRVALLQERSVDLCVDILAGLCSGVSVSILSKSDSVDLSCDKLRAIGADRLVVDPPLEARAAEIAEKIGIVVELRSVGAQAAHPATPPQESEALVIFTSGSTSAPKGVALSQRNIAVNTRSLTEVIPVTPADHLLQVMPIHHTNGLLNQIIMPFAMGARVTLVSHFEPEGFVAALAETQPTYFTAVPTMLSRLLACEIPPAAVQNLRFIRSGAAPLAPEIHKRVEAHFGCDVIVSYGQTEMTCTSTANPPDARKIGSVGRVLAGREATILAPGQDTPMKAGQSGEVCFRGPCIATGFVGEPAFDSRAWFRTGDCGYLDEDGYLFLTGRLKHIIIRGGANLSPRQIEDGLLGDDGVAAVQVLGVPDADLGEVPVACIVPTRPLRRNALNQHLAESLSPAHRLKDIFEFHQLPLNDIGKVDARRLTEDVTGLSERRQLAGLTARCEDTVPLHYIQRTRDYYAKLGFGTPYEWARNDDIPFCPLRRPLSDATVAIVTTAAPYQLEAGDQGPGAPYNAAAKFYQVFSGPTSQMPDLRISHVAIDRDNTHADDIGTYFPLEALRAASGRIGRIAPRFHGLPTNRSQRVTVTIDAQDLLARCQADQVDAVIFVPNCPVCHQSVTLAARVLEAGGLSTVVMGCASDIVQSAGAPRFVFSDFPLGNSAGRPYDPQSQAIVLHAALDALEHAPGPGVMVQTPLVWVGRPDWKSYYSNPDLLSAAEVAERRAKFDAAKDVARALRETASQ